MIPTTAEAVELYLDYRQNTVGVSPGTMKHARSQLRRFAGWVQNEHKRDILASSLRTADFEGFHRWCSQPKPLYLAGGGKGSGSAHLNLVRINLRGFARYCVEEGWCRADNSRRIQFRKTIPRLPLYLPVDDWPRILNAAGAMHPRDRAAVALGLYTFQRGGEIKTLRIADLDLGSCELVTTQHKTHGRDVMPLMGDCVDEMRTWLSWYEDHVGVLEPDMLLIPAKTSPAPWAGRSPSLWDHSQQFVKLKPHAAITNPETIVQRALSVLGYPTQQEGFHTLRRSGARALFNTLAEERSQDSALEIVSSMLHHKTRAMTEHYLGLEPARRKRDQTIKGFRIGVAPDGSRDHTRL